MKRVLVTGATGRIGGLLVRRLLDDGVAVRVLVRDLGRVPPQLRQAEIVPGEFEDLALMKRALTGIERAFFYTPPNLDPRLFPLAAECGVRHVVLLSSASVTKVPAQSRNPIAERHRRAEESIQQNGLGWTFLRPDLLASNCLQWAASILERDEVRVAYPESLRNPVHEDDVANVAARALLTSGLDRQALTLTGPGMLTIKEQVQKIAEAVGRPIRCVRISPEDAVAEYLASHPTASFSVARLLVEYQHKTVAQAPASTPDFTHATGLSAKTFAAWAWDNKREFMPEFGTIRGS